jgi:hypothetical protein
LEELRHLTGNVNGPILWKDMDSAGNSIINPRGGNEYSPNTLHKVLESLRQRGLNSDYYKLFLNDRISNLKNDELKNLQLEDLPMERLKEWNQAKLLR